MRIAAFVTALLFAHVCAAADRPEATPTGKQLFDRFCAECHAPGLGHPGTQRLGWDRGPNFAVLEQRKDLNAVLVRTVVRQGFREMTPFRPTEINDQELARLSAYLAKVGPR